VSIWKDQFSSRATSIEKLENMYSRLASALTLVVALVDGQFNNPPGVDIWCGKAYREAYVFGVR
jgi:hypothetical protein